MFWVFIIFVFEYNLFSCKFILYYNMIIGEGGEVRRILGRGIVYVNILW